MTPGRRRAEPPLVLLHALKLDEGRHHALNGNFYHTMPLAEALSRRDDLRLLVLCDEYTEEPLRACLPQKMLMPVKLNNGGVVAADRAVVRSVASVQPDVYHRPTGQLPFVRLKCRTIATVADLNFVYLKVSLAKKIYKYLSYWRTAQVADWLICISDYTRSDVLKHLRANPNKITVIYHGTNSLPPADYQAVPGVPAEYWLTFGHQTHKNVETALAALRMRPEREHLVVIGRSDHVENVLKPLAQKLGVAKRVFFAGRVSPAGLRALFERAIGLLFLSKFEGFGLPILEAMGLRCPVISSNICSMPEVVGSAGLLYGPDDVSGIAEGMGRVVSEPGLRAKLVEEGLLQAAKFTWEKEAAETAALYHQLAKGAA